MSGTFQLRKHEIQLKWAAFENSRYLLALGGRLKNSATFQLWEHENKAHMHKVLVPNPVYKDNDTTLSWSQGRVSDTFASRKGLSFLEKKDPNGIKVPFRQRGGLRPSLHPWKSRCSRYCTNVHVFLQVDGVKNLKYEYTEKFQFINEEIVLIILVERKMKV